MSDLDPRRDAAVARRRQVLRWGAVGLFLLALVSIASAGFFVYAVWVVLGAAAVAAALSAVSFAGLEVERELESDEIELGDSVEASLVLTNRKAMAAPWILVEDRIEDGLDVEGPRALYKTLAANELSVLTYRLHSTRRGLFRVGPALIESSGPFGLLRRFRLAGTARFLTVLPRPLAIGQAWPLGHRPVHEVPRRHSLFEDPSRFLGIRQYRPGDSLRRIHWRATARARELQTKLYEPTVLEGMLLALEMSEAAHEGDAARLELMITTAASLADFILRGDQRVALLANGADAAERYPEDWTGDGFRRLEQALGEAGERRDLRTHRPIEIEAAKGGRQRARLLNALARLTPAPGISLPRLLDLELPSLPRSLVVAILTPRVDTELAGALGVLRRAGLDVAVVHVTRPREAGGGVELPRGVGYHRVASEGDVVALGGRRL